MFKEEIFTCLKKSLLQKTINNTAEQKWCFNTLSFFVNFLKVS